MVFLFKSNVVDPPATLYMGKDKYENAEMLDHADPEDIWFHVDDLSSAHVYLRVDRPDWKFDTLPPALLEDCCQLVKHNSIEGNKLSNVKIVYTNYTNLFKGNDYAPGQVTYKDPKLCRFTVVEKRNNEIVNRLKRTMVEEARDWKLYSEQRSKKLKMINKELYEEQRLKRAKEEREKQAIKEAQSYQSIFTEEKMSGNMKGMSSNDYEENFL